MARESRAQSSFIWPNSRPPAQTRARCRRAGYCARLVVNAGKHLGQLGVAGAGACILKIGEVCPQSAELCDRSLGFRAGSASETRDAPEPRASGPASASARSDPWLDLEICLDDLAAGARIFTACNVALHDVDALAKQHALINGQPEGEQRDSDRQQSRQEAARFRDCFTTTLAGAARGSNGSSQVPERFWRGRDRRHMHKRLDPRRGGAAGSVAAEAARYQLAVHVS